MQSTSDYLHMWTLEYWHLSQIYEGTIQEKLTTGKAIRTTNRILNNLGPNRSLRQRVSQLSRCIIEDKPSIHTKSATIHKMERTHG